MFTLFFIVLLIGLFEQRVDQYLEELPDTEQSGVNKFLKGLGEFSSRHTRLVSDYSSWKIVPRFKIMLSNTLEEIFQIFLL